ncbi:MAG TPA: hypothetical protein VHB99_16275, partial [Pirellulales bacterium]|nr:hypothetical protein [Pirellulales bacterium]
MPARALDKTLRDRVRREVRASPALWNEYLDRRRAARKWWWLNAPFWWVSIPGAIIMPISIGCFSALPVLPGFVPDRGQFAGAMPSRELWPLVALSASLVSFSVLIATMLAEQIWRSRDVSVHAYFPVGDRRYLRRQLAGVLAVSSVGCITIAIVLGAVAAIRHATIATWFLVGLFCLADWLVVAATAILIAAYVQWRIYTDFVAVGAILASAIAAPMLGAGGAQAVAMSPAIAYLVFALSPPGWVHAAFYFGAIEGSWEASLFLLPAATVVGLAARWFAGTFAIGEFAFSQGRATIASVAGSLRLATPRFWDQRQSASAAATRREPKVTFAEDTASPAAIVPKDFCRPRDWARLGWVERFVSARLTERQRLLLEYSSPGQPYWTGFWAEGLAFATLAGLVLCCPSDARDQGWVFLAGFLNFIGLLSAILMGSGGRGWHGYFPVGFRELLRALFAQALWRGAAAIPAMLALNVIGAQLGGRSLFDTVVGFAASCLTAFAS